MSLEPLTEQPNEPQVPWAVVIIIIVIVLGGATWLLLKEEPEPVVIAAKPEIIKQEVETPVAEIEAPSLPVPPAIEENVEEQETAVEVLPPEPKLPTLDESDSLLIEKLPEITWRKELLKLVITEDLIRRFVVFTDNFSQGSLSYDHTPFVLPKQGFYAKEDIIKKQTHFKKVEYKDFLYYGSQQDVLNSLARLERSIDSILIVGHNPMIPELIALLTGQMLLNYPTCSLALINTNSWTSLRESKLKFIINSDKLT